MTFSATALRPDSDTYVVISQAKEVWAAPQNKSGAKTLTLDVVKDNCARRAPTHVKKDSARISGTTVMVLKVVALRHGHGSIQRGHLHREGEG